MSYGLHLLNKTWLRYGKSKFSADGSIDTIDIAINNAKKYENDIYLLKDHIMMNIHLLFEKLISK